MKHCPNCTTQLKDNKNLAQGVKECKYCGGRYFIIETTRPKFHIGDLEKVVKESK